MMAFGCKKEDDEPQPQPNNPPTEATYDIVANGIPKFVETHFTILDSVTQVSKFRSGLGHDYSDEFEECRSMKHYYPVPMGTNIYAPISGTVNFVLQESQGYKIQINSSDQPAFYFELFHLNLANPVEVGDAVTEGQLMGTHISNQTMTDIGVFVKVPSSNAEPDVRLISYFDVMTDNLFQSYVNRGVLHRDSCIISQFDRDLDPLDCNTNWPAFTGAGNIPNWVSLQ